ncbi:MobC family plasmid mobilization relaxosome protein [Micrococcus luteus]|nr:MobC family plasmid mobilization relaxosome protein [Micrococcus luteus]
MVELLAVPLYFSHDGARSAAKQDQRVHPHDGYQGIAEPRGDRAMTASTTKSGRARRQRTIFSKRLELRLTERQFRLASETAKRLSEIRDKKVTVSDYLRMLIEDGGKGLIQGLERVSHAPAGILSQADVDRIVAALQEVRDEVRRVGHNVNQMTKVAHQSGQVADDLDGVKQALAGIDAHVLDAAKSFLGYEATDEEEG